MDADAIDRMMAAANGQVAAVPAGLGGGALGGVPVSAKRMKLSGAASAASAARAASVKAFRSRTSPSFEVKSPFGLGNIRSAKHKHYINALSNYAGYDRVGASSKQRALWNQLSGKLSGPQGAAMRLKARAAATQAAANRQQLYDGVFQNAKQQRALELAAGLDKSSSSAAKRHYFKATMGNSPAGPYDIATFLTGKGRANRVRPAAQEMLKAIMKQASAKGVTFNSPSQFFHLLHTFTNANSARYNDALTREGRLQARQQSTGRDRITVDEANGLRNLYVNNWKANRVIGKRKYTNDQKTAVKAAAAAEAQRERRARAANWKLEKSAFGKISY